MYNYIVNYQTILILFNFIIRHPKATCFIIFDVTDITHLSKIGLMVLRNHLNYAAKATDSKCELLFAIIVFELLRSRLT